MNSRAAAIMPPGEGDYNPPGNMQTTKYTKYTKARHCRHEKHQDTD